MNDSIPLLSRALFLAAALISSGEAAAHGSRGPTTTPQTSGTTFRLHGQGIPHLRSGRRGDQIVFVRVVIPKNLTEAQRKALQELGGVTGKPQPIEKGFFDRFKEAIGF